MDKINFIISEISVFDNGTFVLVQNKIAHENKSEKNDYKIIKIDKGE